MELMPHQKADAAFLASKPFAGNFSGMGSGKTLTALEAVNLLDLKPNDRILIIAPPIALHMILSLRRTNSMPELGLCLMT